MATIRVLTAERMLQIEAESIVDGTVVGDDLILTRHDASQINAGNVRGPAGWSPKEKPTISGSRDGNAALANLLSALETMDLITDSTTA